MGHSQGSRIAAELASDRNIDKVVYMSADPLGRIATVMDKEYAKFRKRHEEKIATYDSIFVKKEGIYWGDTYESWRSFSKPPLIAISKTEKPILIVYGEMDKSCPNCYIFKSLPLYLNHVQVLNYPQYDHNFFNAEGKNNWDLVMKDVFAWINGN